MEKDIKNRIIKFRGKTYSGNWVYGDLVLPPNRFASIRENCFTTDMPKYEEHQVITETVGQFTGKTDKNGKEIYGGDILKHGRNGMLYVVKFFDGMFYASVEECNENIYGGFPLYVLTDEEDEYKCEVIGNIFDNKDLLKGE